MASISVKMSDSFVKNLDILNKTMTQISEEDRNGRYAKAFRKLLDSIKQEAEEITDNYIFKPMKIGRDFSETEKKELQKIYKACNQKVNSALYKERNAKLFYDALTETQSNLNVWFVMHDGAFDAEYEYNYATGEGAER